MARSDPQVNFRIPADLNNRLKEAAALNNRTLTAELVSRLQESFTSISLENFMDTVDSATMGELFQLQRALLDLHTTQMGFISTRLAHYLTANIGEGWEDLGDETAQADKG